jgi:copper chaperone
MVTTTYQVTGLSCEHCVNAVTSEVRSLDGVSGVSVELVPNGVSRLSITSASPLADNVVGAALDESGGYQVTRA